MEWREDAYTLDELADYLDLSASERRSIDKHYGMGRNCHLFEMTRKWAYRAIRQGWPAFSQWLEAVIQRVEMYNASLPVPLSLAECRAIGRALRNTRTGTPRRKLSHSMWLIRTRQKFRQHAVARAGRPIRQKISRTKGKKAPLFGGLLTNDNRRRALDMYIVGASTEDIAVAVGVSRTIRRWMDNSGEWLTKKQIIKC